jgi:sulfate adenylyltransferase
MSDAYPIPPHGGTLVNLLAGADDAANLATEAANLPKLIPNERELSDLEMLATGALSPLTGFQGEDDYHAVLDRMHLADGLPWAIPVVLGVADDQLHRVGGADAIALCPSEDAAPIAILRVSGQFKRDKHKEALSVYRTDDMEHPGVKAMYDSGDTCVAGTLEVIALPAHEDFVSYRLTPRRDARHVPRARLEDRRRVPDAQPDPPGARVHPEVRARDRRRSDGPSADGRDQGRRRAARRADAVLRGLVRRLLPARPRMISVFPAAMRYAGPREAIWHAIARKNYGCTHFIVGRDHAGVGSYYGTYDAQKIFEEFEPGELGIQPLMFEHSFWCNK